MTDYRATPEQWAQAEEHCERAYGSSWMCLLELRARVEALEANSSAGLASSNHPEKPDSSLVERVARAISGIGPKDAINWEPEARAAIREVAAWMSSNPDHHFPPALVFVLEQEAEQ